jgi:hypothetical protein
MRLFLLILGTLFLFAAGASATPATPPVPENLRFDILRDGSPIGTATMLVRRDGTGTAATTDIRIQVKFGFVTLYRFDRTESETWSDGHFATFASHTDDNGTIHDVSARLDGNGISVDADGKVAKVNRSAIPASAWNPALIKAPSALDPDNGDVLPLQVVDRGDERIEVLGRPVTAHRYAIEGKLAEDVWYDPSGRLVRVELRGRDGSDIEYRPK